MKKQIKEQKKFIYNLISCIFIFLILVFSFLPVSLGWFASNSKVNSKGVGIVIEDNDLGVDFTFFNAKSVTSDTSIIDGTIQKSITFDDTEKTTIPELPLYDILDETTHYILIKFASNKAFTITISTETNYVLDSSKPLLSGDGRGVDYSNWLSSVIFFQEVVINNDSYVATLSDNPFLFVDKSDYSIKANNTLSVHCSANLPIYLIVGYDSALINRLFSQNIGNKNIENIDDEGVKFVSDCIFTVTFDNESGGIV